MQLAQQTTGAGTTFLRWRNLDRSCMGVELWEALLDAPATPATLIDDLYAMEVQRIALNMQVSLTHSIARQALDCAELTPEQKALMLSARKEAGKFSEGVILSKSMEVLFRAVPPSLYLAMAMTEPEEKAERYQLMQRYGIGELDAAFKVAEAIDRARGIEPLALRIEEGALICLG